VITEPYRFESRLRPEVIDVPVRAFGRADVMSQPSAYASRPKCAADVNVKASLEPQVSELPNTNQFVRC